MFLEALTNKREKCAFILKYIQREIRKKVKISLAD